jgi:hypothetical protein
MHDKIESEMIRLAAESMSRRSDPSESRLRQLESMPNISLPTSYRQFLTRYGRFRVRAEATCKTLPGAYIDYFYGFPENGADDSGSTGEFDELGLVPVGLAIGCDMFGNQIVMFSDEWIRERIYVHEHDGGVDFRDDPDWQESGLSWRNLTEYDDS